MHPVSFAKGHFIKGHATENDFIVLPDPDGELLLTPRLVRALCHRRAGVGADGVLRVVRTEHAPADAPRAGGAEWFMDYRNADGSTAEMCGNGIRLYARYLVDSGLATAGTLALGTRNGVRQVYVGATGDVCVDMGSASVVGPASAAMSGHTYEGIAVDIGNPHLVCPVDGQLNELDLTAPPVVDTAVFPNGVNVEFVASCGDRHVSLRVCERGVGETRSCGTGACAVAVALASESGGRQWTVDVPGGRLQVTLDGDTVRLTGPAVIVGAGTLDPAWLATATGPTRHRAADRAARP